MTYETIELEDPEVVKKEDVVLDEFIDGQLSPDQTELLEDDLLQEAIFLAHQSLSQEAQFN
jgi:hypothetical protein